MRLLLFSEEETYKFGIKIAEILRGGEMILLAGEMGAGKTALTKGIARGLGINEIGSPTFTLLNIYQGRLTMYHYDLFRLTSIEEAEEAGLLEFFGTKGGVCVVEWPDKLPDMFDEFDAMRITMKYIDSNTREAIITGYLQGRDFL